MTVFKITVEYNGTDYSGMQKITGCDRPTIQNSLELALQKVCGGTFVPIDFCGRTDAGVHAFGQVCHFTLPCPDGLGNVDMLASDESEGGFDREWAGGAPSGPCSKLGPNIRAVGADVGSEGEAFRAPPAHPYLEKSADSKVVCIEIEEGRKKDIIKNNSNDVIINDDNVNNNIKIKIPCKYAVFTRNPWKLSAAINFYLIAEREGVSVISCEIVQNDFHSRFSCVQRVYRYKVLNRTSISPIYQKLAWHVPRELSIEKMVIASQFLVGNHNFSAFRRSGCMAKSAVVTLDYINIFRDQNEQDIIIFEVAARSFLYGMVRNIVGTLIDIGSGKITSPHKMIDILKSCDRKSAGIGAPAHGLYFYNAKYEDR